MIDPFDVTKYDRTIPELEEFLLFCICVAGKQANKTAERLGNILEEYERGEVKSPFLVIQRLLFMKKLEDKLKEYGFGQYRKLTKALTQIARSGFDLRKCSVEDLETIHGVGPKTSRYFILHTRKDSKVACLDVHILGYLRGLGHEAPKTTPTGKKYLELEQIF